MTVAMLFGMFSMLAVSADTQQSGATGAITPDTSWYDDDVSNATNSTFVLDTAAELLGFAKILADNSSTNGTGQYPFFGDTVKLGADIDLNPGWTASATATAPANVWPQINCAFGGTFDGRGYTVSGVYQKTDATGLGADYQGVGGMFGRPGNGKNVVIKNLNVENSYFESNQIQGHGALLGQTNSPTTVENVYVDAYVVNTATMGADYGVGGLIGGINNATLNLKNAVFAGDIVLTSTTANQKLYVGGLMGRNNGNGNKTVENCAFYGSIDVTANSCTALMVSKLVAYQSAAGSTMTFKNCIAGGTIDATGTAMGENGSKTGTIVAEAVAAARYNKNFSLVAFDNVLYTGTAPVLGCGYEQTPNGNIYTSDPAEGIKYYTGSVVADPAPKSVSVTDASLQGTAASSTLTSNNLTNAFGTVENGYVLPLTVITTPDEEVVTVPELTIEGLPANASIDWYNDNRNSGEDFVIANEADFLGYGYILATKTNKFFSGKTVKLNADIDLNPEWDANAETLSAPTVIWPVSGGSAKTHFAGTLDGQGHTVKGLYVNATIERAGLFGLVGESSYAAIKNINITNSCIVSSFDGVGAIFGSSFGNNTTVISNVYCDANVICTATTNVADSTAGRTGMLGVGGITGGVTYTNGVFTLTIEKTVYAGNITTSFTTDSFAKDSTSGVNVGGIIGFVNPGAGSVMNIKNTAFYGTIKGVMPESGNVGGILGLQKSRSITIENCISAGRFEVTGIKLGFIGSVYGDIGPGVDQNGDKATVVNVLYTGDVGTGGFYELPEGSYTVQVEPATIKGAAATAVLTENNLTEWSATEDAYPLPTALSTQIGDIEVPAPVPAVAETPTGGGSNNNNNTDDDEKDDTTDTEAPAADDSEDEAEVEEKKGCGSSIFGGMATVLCAGAAVIAIKKKKD